jgi:hypothetical protein
LYALLATGTRSCHWRSIIPLGVVAILVTVVPYALISLAWNISGHVVFTLVPTLYLTLVDRRFAPLLVVPIIMVPNRPIVEMHTWPQAIAGFLLGLAGVAVTMTLVRHPQVESRVPRPA